MHSLFLFIFTCLCLATSSAISLVPTSQYSSLQLFNPTSFSKAPLDCAECFFSALKCAVQCKKDAECLATCAQNCSLPQQCEECSIDLIPQQCKTCYNEKIVPECEEKCKNEECAPTCYLPCVAEGIKGKCMQECIPKNPFDGIVSFPLVSSPETVNSVEGCIAVLSWPGICKMLNFDNCRITVQQIVSYCFGSDPVEGHRSTPDIYFQ